MRLAGLVFSLIVLTAGVLLGIVYPKTMENAVGREIGQWTVYSSEAGFAEAEASLFASDGATVMKVAARNTAPLRAAPERELLVLTVLDGAGAEIYRAPLGSYNQETLESPQTGVVLYRFDAGKLDAADGRHRFVVEAGRDFPDSLLTVELALNAERYNIQPEARPVGMGLMALGGICLLFSLRRRRENPNSSASPTKWGRR